MKESAMNKLVQVMDELLAPNGCPWDREQTHQTLTRYLVEEAYEVLEAIEEADMNKLREELGDLLLQVVFHAALAKRDGHFDLDDVADTVKEKMIRRHPHVFGQMEITTSDGVMDVWEGFKRKEGKQSIMEGIPQSLPALLRSYKIQEKARRVGFDWPDVSGAVDKLQEEVIEFVHEKHTGDQERLKEEMGDLIFAMVNIARMSDIEPEEALQRSNDKFIRRFQYIENTLKTRGEILEEAGLERLDALWDEAKRLGL
ncbi:MAG: nucleoside triphosphate pyrophosphohydrolase [Acidobacteriota bacterium]